jgi:WD40 repeat protein
VTCLSLCENDQYLVSGGKDTMLVVYEFENSNEYLTNNFKNIKYLTPKLILYGHDDEINDVIVNNDLNVVVSVSKDKTCIIHSLNKGKYIRTIKLKNNHTIDLVTISEDGYIILYSNSSKKFY